MATTSDGRQRQRSAALCACFALMITVVPLAASAEEAEQPSDQAVCVRMIEEMAVQVHEYCHSRNVRTLQCLKFVGTHGSVSNEALEQRLIESLKKLGIEVQKSDSTRLRGELVSQRAGSTSILLVQCTLTDISGAELQTFRLRQVVNG